VAVEKDEAATTDQADEEDEKAQGQVRSTFRNMGGSLSCGVITHYNASAAAFAANPSSTVR